MYQILVMDYDECFFAKVYSDGEIEEVFHEKSLVPHKHRKGGQSAARFAGTRDVEITHWFKKIDQMLHGVAEEFYLGISSVYSKRFLDTLSTYNQAKIKEIHSTEYTDLCGIYQFISKLEGKNFKNNQASC
jgi:peptide subunit release factor 1 (eRF1)